MNIINKHENSMVVIIKGTLDSLAIVVTNKYIHVKRLLFKCLNGH